MSDILSEQASETPHVAALERVKIVTAYFGLCAGSAAILTLVAVVGVAFPRLGWRTHPGNAPLGLALLTIGTFALARTYFLLRRQRRSGAIAAGLCLAASLSGSLWAREYSWSLFPPALGLIFLAGAWRHFRRDP